MGIRRPSELVEHFASMLEYAADGYPQRDGAPPYTINDAFNDAFHSLNGLHDCSDGEEGKERLLECERHLRFAREFFDEGNTANALRCIRETLAMFEKCVKYISASGKNG